MMLWPRTTISPTLSLPGGSGCSSESMMRICTPQIGLPIEYSLRSSALRLNDVVAAVSDSP